MANRGKSINLFLMDGDVTGRIKCTIAGWTGVVYKIRRTELDNSKERSHLKQSGVYFLFGTSDQTGESMVYIGQAGARKNGEGILNRLLEHRRNPDKDYWIEAVAITTTDDTFGPTEISYLENRFCNLAVDAKRYTVKNNNDPTQGHITEEKESELESFIDYTKIILGTLGYKIFVPFVESETEIYKPGYDIAPEPILLLNNKKANARGKRTSDGFVVFKGSQIALSPTPSCPDTIKRLREKHQSKIDKNGILLEDILFSSPSASAGFAMYASANGNILWFTEDGKTLKALEN